MKNNLKTYLYISITLIIFHIIELKPMQQALKYSQAGTAARTTSRKTSLNPSLLAKRADIIRIQFAKQLKKPYWLKTKNGELYAMDEWQIDQMDMFRDLSYSQEKSNNQDNPMNADTFSKKDLELLTETFNAIAKGEFSEYQKNLMNKDSYALEELIELANKVDAKALSAFLRSYSLLDNEQKSYTASQIIYPVATYLQQQILRDHQPYTTVLAGHTNPLVACKFSKDGKVIVTATKGEEKNIVLWDAKNGTKTKVFSTGKIKSLEINDDGSKIIAISTNDSDNQSAESIKSKDILTLWNGKTGERVKTFDEFSDFLINQAEFSNNNNTIIISISATNESKTNSYKDVRFIVINADNGSIITTYQIPNAGRNFKINPNGNTFLIQGDKYKPFICKTMEQRIIPWETNINSVYEPTYSSDGTKIVTYNTNSTAIWNAETGSQEELLSTEDVKDIAINHNGTKLAFLESTNLSIYDIKTKSSIDVELKNNIDKRTRTSLTFSPHNNILALWDSEKLKVILLNSINGKMIKSLSYTQFVADGIVDFNNIGTRIKMSGKLTQYDDNKDSVVCIWKAVSNTPLISSIGNTKLLDINKDLTAMISQDKDNNQNIVLWRLFAPEKEDALVQIERNLNITQSQLLYQLYIAKISNFSTSLNTQNLPTNIQSLIVPYFKIISSPKAINKPNEDLSIVPQTWINWVNSWWKK